jgi:hypothetical protein
VRLNFGDSKRPYFGRGGRSGVTLFLLCSDTDAERPLLLGNVLSGQMNGAGALVTLYKGMRDSLMLRPCF